MNITRTKFINYVKQKPIEVLGRLPTLVKKMVEKLETTKVECEGFYTEEVRSCNSRIGFDIVTLTGEKGILARKNPPQGGPNKPLVGQYAVFVEDFEKLALPVFENSTKLLIIDEIGKMEMFSKKFQKKVAEVFENKTIQIIATIPLKGGPVLVRQLKERKDCQLITLNQTNRDNLVDEIIRILNMN